MHTAGDSRFGFPIGEQTQESEGEEILAGSSLGAFLLDESRIRVVALFIVIVLNKHNRLIPRGVKPVDVGLRRPTPCGAR